MNEIIINEKVFKKIPGYNQYYASKDGVIYSDKRKKILSIQHQMGTYKYEVVCLYKDTKMTPVPVHKLVALAWCPIPDKYNLTLNDVIGNYLNHNLVVNHKDENKYNNNADNLEWLLSIENANYGKRNIRIAEKLNGNQNAKGKKPSNNSIRYDYFLDNKQYSMKELISYLNCTKSKITESFRRNLGLVKVGRLTRVPKTKADDELFISANLNRLMNNKESIEALDNLFKEEK